MPNNVLFLVHGMGWNLEQTAGSAGWSDEVTKSLQAGWKLFPSLKAHALADFVEFVPIGYDHVFRDYLHSVAGAAARVQTALGSNEFAKVAKAIAGADTDEAGFFWTNVMDVLLYRFGADLYRDVHVEVALQIGKKVEQVWKQGGSTVQFSAISHSLGTAVLHGALNRMAGGPIGNSHALQVGGNFKLRSYIALANVSRVLWPEASSMYNATRVRPTIPSLGSGLAKGYVDHFVNARHVADPFPAPLRFAPNNWGAGYREIALSHLRDANVHGFSHYLAHPRVAAAVFQPLLPPGLLPPAEVDAVAAGYRDVDLADPKKRAQVEQVIANIAQDLKQSYDNQNNLVLDSAELLARMLRDVWHNLQKLKAVQEAVT